jgi:hypothetical protein
MDRPFAVERALLCIDRYAACCGMYLCIYCSGFRRATPYTICGSGPSGSALWYCSALRGVFGTSGAEVLTRRLAVRPGTVYTMCCFGPSGSVLGCCSVLRHTLYGSGKSRSARGGVKYRTGIGCLSIDRHYVCIGSAYVLIGSSAGICL